MTTRFTVAIALCAALGVALPGTARSAAVNDVFTGTVTSVAGNPLAGFPAAPSVGSAISGGYTFDSSTPATISFGGGINANYFNALSAFNIAGFNLNGLTLQTNTITVNKSFSGPGLDYYGVLENAFSADGRYYYRISLDFFDQTLPDASLPSSDSLSLTSDTMTPDNSAFFNFQILDGQNLSLDPPIFNLFGTINGITDPPASVAEPTSLSALLAGLIALSAWRHAPRKRRSAFG
jgi:hypothetical protein